MCLLICFTGGSRQTVDVVSPGHLLAIAPESRTRKLSLSRTVRIRLFRKVLPSAPEIAFKEVAGGAESDKESMIGIQPGSFLTKGQVGHESATTRRETNLNEAVRAADASRAWKWAGVS